MKNEQLYNKTIDILVQAYHNDTLQHSTVYGCAVGNLIAANMGYITRKSIGGLRWEKAGKHVYSGDSSSSWYEIVNFGERLNGTTVPQQISSTGYNIKELHVIERAFEKGGHINCSDEDIFDRLMRVVEVLDNIHDNTSKEITTKSKRKFQKVS